MAAKVFTFKLEPALATKLEKLPKRAGSRSAFIRRGLELAFAELSAKRGQQDLQKAAPNGLEAG